MALTDKPEPARPELRDVIPRRAVYAPRCPDCKTGTMFHPSHQWGPCDVILDGGDQCDCVRPSDVRADVSPACRD